MENPSAQPLPPPPSWTNLAQGQREGDSISRCPAGHIHLDYGNLTLRLEGDEFLSFARMVAEAASLLGGRSPLPPPPPGHGVGSSFSLN